MGLTTSFYDWWVTAPFNNMRALLNKRSRVFAAVNYLSGRLRKQMFTSKGRVRGLWLVDFDSFCFFFFFQGPLVVAGIMIDVACSRLSDSGDEAKKNGRAKGVWEPKMQLGSWSDFRLQGDSFKNPVRDRVGLFNCQRPRCAEWPVWHFDT